MIKLIFSTVLSSTCPEPVIEIMRPLTWTDHDAMILKRATQDCVDYYGEDSCLVKFIKAEERTYRAVCKKAKASNR